MAAQGLAMTEQGLLAAAQRGDEDAFGRLVGPYRRELHAHCYRMLGSAADAEDVLQDALLGAWRGLPRFQARSSLRSWLYTIATNACLKAIQRRPRRVLPIDYGPPADPHDYRAAPPIEAALWIDPLPTPEGRYEQRESVELAFIAALQHLPARQRAVLILRDVLGFSARETGDALEMKPAAVDSAMQRAKKTVEERLPRRTQQAALQTLDDAELRAIVDGYMDAWDRSDVDALAAMLADEATFTMPPQSAWFRGRDAIATFLAAYPLRPGMRWRVVPTRANGQLAFGHYYRDGGDFVGEGLAVLALRGSEIAELTVFRTSELLERFGLPERFQSRGEP
jgi:RNA polymerase sigma-70 factor, ECF subfamily